MNHLSQCVCGFCSPRVDGGNWAHRVTGVDGNDSDLTVKHHPEDELYVLASQHSTD